MITLRTVGVALALCGSSLLRAGVAVDFPSITDEKAPLFSGIYLMPDMRGKAVPYHMEGKLVFFMVEGGGGDSGFSIEKASFDKVWLGMTLDQLVSLLGPGTVSSFSGTASASWKCEDGRILSLVCPPSIHQTAKFTIRQQGEDQRHEEVRKLAEKLIASIEIADGAVRVALTEDTHQAKAMVMKTYRVNETFQRRSLLPGIGFTITSIKDDAVHCRYSYQPSPDGVYQYSETGSIILRKTGKTDAGK